MKINSADIDGEAARILYLEFRKIRTSRLLISPRGSDMSVTRIFRYDAHVSSTPMIDAVTCIEAYPWSCIYVHSRKMREPRVGFLKSGSSHGASIVERIRVDLNNAERLMERAETRGTY